MRPYLIALLSVIVAVGTICSATEFRGKRSDLKPFIGIWEGEWDGFWPVRFGLKEDGGRLIGTYEYKNDVSSPDYKVEQIGELQLLDDGTLLFGYIHLEIPSDPERRGKELIGSHRNNGRVMRGILKNIPK